MSMPETNSNSTRINYGKLPNVLEPMDLIAVQKESYKWFWEEGLRELFDELNPIQDYTGKNFELRFGKYELGEPKYSVEECKDRDMTYAAPLRVHARLVIKDLGEIRESTVYMGDFPLMTEQGTFIINGTERVVVSQLVRSPGVYFTESEDPATGKRLYGAKLIPNRGAWIEIETSARDVLIAKIDRKKKVPVTMLIKALELPELSDLNEHSTVEEQLRAFSSVFGISDSDELLRFIRATLEKDPSTDCSSALLEFYRKLRPGDPATIESARNLLFNLFFNHRRYDLGRVGRYKLDKRLELADGDIMQRVKDMTLRVLTAQDIIAMVKKVIEYNLNGGQADDIDHLGNRRVRSIGELLQNQFRIGLLRMERVVKERMTICDPANVTPSALINMKPVAAAVKEFFGSSQLSQFMDQTNPLAELTHKRRLSALGPGGLSRERAGFDVRDVHHSHYGRICPIETPEGPNIGLIGSLATYARVNQFGFIETPYRKVYNKVSVDREDLLLGQILREDVKKQDGSVLFEKGCELDEQKIELLKKEGVKEVLVVPFISDEIVNLSADDEDRCSIGQANVRTDEKNRILDARVPARVRSHFAMEDVTNIEYVDVSPKQIVSVSTSLIPFLEHDDANRALMGSNMQRQAVPLIQTEAPLIGTGMEITAGRYSGGLIVAKKSGIVVDVAYPVFDATRGTYRYYIRVRNDDGTTTDYELSKFERSNQGTCFNHRTLVKPGQRVEAGEILADGACLDHGELALGRNVLVAFMPWEGYNFEDAILISENLVRDDIYTSIHIEEYEIEARDTKLGPEEITRDIPNVGEDALRHLDERGIVYPGAEVGPRDILVGKVTPKGEVELSAEERLLRAVFGDRSRDVKDSSLRVPHGERGVVVDVKVFSEEKGDDMLPSGVRELVRVYVAQKRKISEGDKMAGRHGNKGVVAKVLPAADMPFLPDGTPVDIVLNPLGVPSRMNLGQVLETHLGWVAKVLGYKIATPVFDGAPIEKIKQELERAGLPANGRIKLRDGRTGEEFKDEVTVGVIYMMKLAHLVEDKIHARSTGPYSLVTQQPLGGKAQFGGQRFGEMEVWALEAYGAAHTLQELLTIKSDDITGRTRAYEAIVKGENTLDAGISESFRVLVKELQGLALGVKVLDENEQPIMLSEEDTVEQIPLDLGIDLERDELGM